MTEKENESTEIGCFGDYSPCKAYDSCPVKGSCVIKQAAAALQTIKNPYLTQVGGSHYQDKHDLMQLCIENKVEAGEYAVIKYVYRHAKKDGMKDLRKAQHVLQMIAYSKYGEEL